MFKLDAQTTQQTYRITEARSLWTQVDICKWVSHRPGLVHLPVISLPDSVLFACVLVSFFILLLEPPLSQHNPPYVFYPWGHSQGHRSSYQYPETPFFIPRLA